MNEYAHITFGHMEFYEKFQPKLDLHVLNENKIVNKRKLNFKYWGCCMWLRMKESRGM